MATTRRMIELKEMKRSLLFRARLKMVDEMPDMAHYLNVIVLYTFKSWTQKIMTKDRMVLERAVLI